MARDNPGFCECDYGPCDYHQDIADQLEEAEKKLRTWEMIAERDHGKPAGSFRALVEEILDGRRKTETTTTGQ